MNKSFFIGDVINELRPMFPGATVEISRKCYHSVSLRRDNWQWRIRVFGDALVIGWDDWPALPLRFDSVGELAAYIKTQNLLAMLAPDYV